MTDCPVDYNVKARTETRGRKVVDLPLHVASAIKNGEFFFSDEYDLRRDVVPVDSAYQQRLAKVLPAIITAALKCYCDAADTETCSTEQ